MKWTGATAMWLLVAGTARTDDSLLERLLGRAAEYVLRYEQEFSSIAAQEHYVQRQTLGRTKPQIVVRRMESEVVFVRLAGDLPWSLFRDVFQVDGQTLHDREARLEKLFIKPPADARERIHDIVEESARYNVGLVRRNFNVPTLALLFLLPKNQAHFQFRSLGLKQFSGKLVQEIEFQERASPTVIQQDPGGDIAAHGRFLVDPDSGTILRSDMRLDGEGDVLVSIRVSYRFLPAMSLWVPAEMKESYAALYQPQGHLTGELPNATEESIDCSATYSHFRRFQVSTEEKSTPEKKRP